MVGREPVRGVAREFLIQSITLAIHLMKVGIVRKLPAFPRIKAALLCAALAIGPAAALAQGSAGGSIGNDDKEITGPREPKRAQPEKSHQEESRKPAAHGKEESRTRANFDGRWSFVTTGCSGAGTIGASIRRGRFTTPISHGTISPEGAFHAVGGGRGHMESSNGSGTFRRSDGCSGSWHASKSSTRSRPK